MSLSLILTALIYVTPLAFAKSQPKKLCDYSLRKESTFSVTEQFLSYLSRLYHEDVITHIDLQKILRTIIQQERIINPLSEKNMGQSALIHHLPVFQSYVDYPNLDLQKIKEWLQKFVSKKQKETKSRQDNITKTKIAHTKMEFHRIEPNQNKVSIYSEINHPFLMMSTVVTQKMWIDVMGYSSSTVENTASKMQGDHPMINLTMWSALVFANELSKREGLTPAYDLSEVPFSGSAADGTLTMKLSAIKINAPDGDILKAEGYRLPTTTEFYYARSNRGEVLSGYFPGLNDKNIEEYAWYEKNSNNVIHSVADLKPLVIDGKKFYDLYGNVSEMLHFYYERTYNGKLMLHRNEMDGSTENAIKTGYFGSSESETMQGTGTRAANFSWDTLGFRLVRSLPTK